jgi:hypothetical protein
MLYVILKKSDLPHENCSLEIMFKEKLQKPSAVKAKLSCQKR